MKIKNINEPAKFFEVLTNKEILFTGISLFAIREFVFNIDLLSHKKGSDWSIPHPVFIRETKRQDFGQKGQTNSRKRLEQR